MQAEEEARSLQKKIQQIENELDQTQEQLMQVNAKLEEKDKALQNVSVDQITLVSSCEGPTGARVAGFTLTTCHS